MLDGNLSTTWSNFYHVPATANLLAVSSSNPSDWVSLSWESPQQLSGLTAYFTTGGAKRQLGDRVERGDHDHLRPGAGRC